MKGRKGFLCIAGFLIVCMMFEVCLCAQDSGRRTRQNPSFGYEMYKDSGSSEQLSFDDSQSALGLHKMKKIRIANNPKTDSLTGTSSDSGKKYKNHSSRHKKSKHKRRHKA